MDLPLLMLAMLLLGVGLIMVMSASYATAYYDAKTDSPLAYAIAQGRFALLGVLAMYGVSRFNYQYLRGLSLILLAFSVLLLVLVLTPLGVANKGAQRWLHIFLVAGPTFQPSEIVKVAVILFFSSRLCVREKRKPTKWTKRTRLGRTLNLMERVGLMELLPYIGILALIALLLLKEPHLSGTILVFVGGAAVLFASGIHWGWFVSGITLVGSALALVIKFTPYMTSRIMLWLDPWSDALGKGYQTIQSLYSIGSGGLLGRGLGKSVQKYLFLPEPENDFIFSIAVEELGFVGGILILGLFMMFILRGYWIALHARDRFGALTAVGITTLFAVQVFLNIGVVTNLIPNTGISLPFFSYGGTALIIQLAEVGILLSISRQIPAPKQD
ncbi:MAG: FtsW/RodA/SpoVE family cell cycle protein [Oscillospiraceae bacterium]|nr:FtsW/RodA/SpoVE family cell cycle protein [Oscillospiraceae bacterium]